MKIRRKRYREYSGDKINRMGYNGRKRSQILVFSSNNSVPLTEVETMKTETMGRKRNECSSALPRTCNIFFFQKTIF